MLENTVRKYPDKVGFICSDWRLTFKEFDGIVNRIAAALEKYGVKRGDHVAMLSGIAFLMAGDTQSVGGHPKKDIGKRKIKKPLLAKRFR